MELRHTASLEMSFSPMFCNHTVSQGKPLSPEQREPGSPNTEGVVR